MAALIEINKISGGMENLQTTAENVSKAIAAFFKDNLGPTLGSTLSDISNIITGLNKIQELMGQGSKSSGEIMGGGTTKFREQFKQEPSGLGGLFKGWFGGDSGDLPKNARPRMYSSTDDIDKDSNKVLHDIRDMMQRSEIRAGGGGSGGGGGTPGGGGSGPIFRPGIGGMGGTRGNRNNNRGNIKFGEFAKSMGATGQDERGFAVFPDQATGDAAHAALLKSPAYQGLTLDQFGNKYSEGNADWKRTVGAALGIGPGDIVNTNDPRLMEGIRRAEGTASGGRMDPMAPTGMRPIGGQGVTSITSPSGRSFTVAKEFAANFQGFINDYEGAGGKIGPESGGVGSRGNPSYHPLGRAIDINQAGYGIRSRSGTTLPQDVEDKLAMKWGLFPGSQFKSRSDIGHFEVRNAELAAEARERLDKSMRTEPLNGSLNATVDFSNVPSGVKTNAKGSGFKLLRVTSSKQNQQSTEGLLGPGDGLYTQFVP
jgi:hypothetical protein